MRLIYVFAKVRIWQSYSRPMTNCKAADFTPKKNVKNITTLILAGSWLSGWKNWVKGESLLRQCSSRHCRWKTIATSSISTNACMLTSLVLVTKFANVLRDWDTPKCSNVATYYSTGSKVTDLDPIRVDGYDKLIKKKKFELMWMVDW